MALGRDPLNVALGRGTLEEYPVEENTPCVQERMRVHRPKEQLTGLQDQGNTQESGLRDSRGRVWSNTGQVVTDPARLVLAAAGTRSLGP